MSLTNPFNPNSIVSSNLFAGRKDQIRIICEKLEQIRNNTPSSFIIYGERGIGKTALAKLIRSISVSNNPDDHALKLITSYYSVESGQELSSVLQESLNKLADEIDSTLLDKIGERLGNIFQNGKFQIGAFGASLEIEPVNNQKKIDISIKDQTVSILSNIIKNLNGEEKDGLLIIIDEIHNLKNIQFAASIFRNIVTTLDVEGLGKVSFLLIGYEEDVAKFFSDDSSARRTFDLFKLDVMPDGEAKEVLTKGFKSTNTTWDEEMLNSNISVAGGYPHSIQIIGHNLIKSDKDKFIDEEDWRTSIHNSAIDLQSKMFSSMYSFGKNLTEKDKILVLLADNNKPLSKRDIAYLSGSKNIYQYIPTLKECGAIKEDENKNISLQSQLFRASILIDQWNRKMQNEQARN